MIDNQRPAIASSTLGAIGRFGNQILQYGFLRLYADRHGLELETSAWIGGELFGCREAPVTPGRPVVTELELGLFGPNFEAQAPATGADIWGWFQVDAGTLARQRDLFRSLFRLESPFAEQLAEAELRLRACGRTLIGLHLRRGDYRPTSGHPLIDRLYRSTPTSQYREWLERLWPSLEKPVLFVASDEPEGLMQELAEFRPKTAGTLGAALPAAPYFPDFFLLSRCAALAISNSTFSFAATLLAPAATTCVRPVPESGRLESFEPWASRPHLALDPARALEQAEPERFSALVASRSPFPVELRARVEPGRHPVRAILGDQTHRGFLEFQADLAGGTGATRVGVRWQDADETEASFEFESRDLQVFHGDHPPNFAGLGQARGARLDGPAWSLLVAAEIPGCPGDLFLALTILAAGPYSFFVEARGQGDVRRAG